MIVFYLDNEYEKGVLQDDDLSFMIALLLIISDHCTKEISKKIINDEFAESELNKSGYIEFLITILQRSRDEEVGLSQILGETAFNFITKYYACLSVAEVQSSSTKKLVILAKILRILWKASGKQ